MNTKEAIELLASKWNQTGEEFLNDVLDFEESLSPEELDELEV